MKDVLTKLLSNPAGIIATCVSVFMFISVLLTALEQFLLSAANVLDSFDTKTATTIDDNASAGLKKCAAVLADILGYTSKIVNWINGFKTVDPTPAPATVPSPSPTTASSDESQKPAA